MSLQSGGHVWAAFYDEADWVEVVILEVRDHEALVQELGTERSDWVPLHRIFEQV